MAGDDPEVLVVNHHQANLHVRDRVAKSGAITQKTMVTVTVTSEPIAIVLDDNATAAVAAKAIAAQIMAQSEGITEQVKQSTADARRVVERAFYRAKPWAWRRYDGGRTGVTPPKTGDTAFNHSGRLSRSIVATWIRNRKEFAINYAANRWNPRDWRSIADMQAAFARWRSHLPALQAPFDDVTVRREMGEAFDSSIRKARMGASAKQAEVVGKVVVGVMKDLLRALS